MRYDQLLSRVQAGEVTLIHVVAPHRSNGNALMQVLTQAQEASGQLNEPSYYGHFQGANWHDGDSTHIETIANRILFRLEQLHPEDKQTLVIHDASADLSERSFKAIGPLFAKRVFVLRDPLEMATSSLLRHVNDQFIQPIFGQALHVYPMHSNSCALDPHTFMTP